jgi:hypothetical protein
MSSLSVPAATGLQLQPDLHTPEFIERYLIALEEATTENPDERRILTDMIRGFPRWLQADMFNYRLQRAAMTDEEYEEACASDAETEQSEEPEEDTYVACRFEKM